MPRRDSTDSSDSSDDSRSSLSDAVRASSAPHAASAPRPPSSRSYLDIKDDESSTDSATDGGLEDDQERERDERRARQAARRAKSTRAREGIEKPTRVMHSLGLNKTTMQKLLHPHSSQGSDDEALLSRKKGSTGDDPEAQTPARRQSSLAAAASPSRKVYIAFVVFLLVVLIVVGVVLGVAYAKRTQEYAASLGESDSQRAADKAAIDAQGQAMQSSLGMVVGDGHGGTVTAAPSNPMAMATAPVDVSLPSPTGALQRFPELQALFAGNREWRNETMTEDATLMHPKFAYVGCADSRVPETTVFNTKPGEIFVTRNVGNQYLVDDLSSETVLSYAVKHLGVQHVVVMGHASCGAVKAAVADASSSVLTDMDETRIDTWIRPIRSLYMTSKRSEIASFREAYKGKEVTGDDVTDDVWRALVEENVKLNVQRVAVDSTVQKSWDAWSKSNHSSSVAASTSVASAVGAQGHRLSKRDADTPVELWVHGWVYDIGTGLVEDLGVSVGPS